MKIVKDFNKWIDQNLDRVEQKLINEERYDELLYHMEDVLYYEYTKEIHRNYSKNQINHAFDFWKQNARKELFEHRSA